MRLPDVDEVSPLHMSASTQGWPCTISGWIWYCDIHDTHGNADFEEEAKAVAAAHEEWWSRDLEDDDDPSCDLVVTMMEPPADLR
jgi:hypothetical protein